MWIILNEQVVGRSTVDFRCQLCCQPVINKRVGSILVRLTCQQNKTKQQVASSVASYADSRSVYDGGYKFSSLAGCCQEVTERSPQSFIFKLFETAPQALPNIVSEDFTLKKYFSSVN